MFIDIENSLEHVKVPEKKIKMKRIIDKIEMVSRNYSKESTDFLDPYERKLAKSILNRFLDLKYTESGGLSDAERQIITIFPDYTYDLSVDDIKVLRIKGDFSNLNHKDFLGALMNLGIVRDKIGDILIHDGYADVICKREISDFIFFNLEKIGNKNVSIEYSNIEELVPVKLKFKEVFKVISSLRIDAYISACYNLSRSKSVKIVKSEKVKINWEEIDKTSTELEEGDIISVKGYGRSLLYSIKGFTKKNNVKATIRILI